MDTDGRSSEPDDLTWYHSSGTTDLLLKTHTNEGDGLPPVVWHSIVTNSPSSTAADGCRVITGFSGSTKMILDKLLQ
ncbi:hypothetical protein WUBG_18503 [Wuchereria bancrofti]|uniref:Uncharacterized protein n=1 Tax=Wuchereria bancrofti TaxID=6293 RepID=J9A9H9_WUCBA|nr:hypothetical protein WUBG_18503 [Wuchereria bancrofti]